MSSETSQDIPLKHIPTAGYQTFGTVDQENIASAPPPFTATRQATQVYHHDNPVRDQGGEYVDLEEKERDGDYAPTSIPVKHLNLEFSECFREHPSTKLHTKLFTGMGLIYKTLKIVVYHILVVMLGTLLVFLWAVMNGIFAFIHVWIWGPLLKCILVWIYAFAPLVSEPLRAFCAPLVNVLARIFRQIRVQTTLAGPSRVAFPENAKEAAEMITYQGAILSEDRITEALRMTGLIPLRDRLGGSRAQVEQNWYDIVSPGETQKIAFARLFFHKPPFAILDEATCALSEECEHYFYTSLQQLGTTVMSVGHRSSLKKYHHQILKLGRNKTWQLLSQDLETPL